MYSTRTSLTHGIDVNGVRFFILDSRFPCFFFFTKIVFYVSWERGGGSRDMMFSHIFFTFRQLIFSFAVLTRLTKKFEALSHFHISTNHSYKVKMCNTYFDISNFSHFHISHYKMWFTFYNPTFQLLTLDRECLMKNLVWFIFTGMI